MKRNRQFRRWVLWCFLVALVVFCAWQPHDPYVVTANSSLRAPSLEHPFGTDRLGRDLYSRTGLALRDSVFRAGVAELASFVTAFLLSSLFAICLQRYHQTAAMVRMLVRLLPPLLFLFAIAGWARESLLGPFAGLFVISFCFAWPVFASEIDEALRHPSVAGTYSLGASPLYVARRTVAPAALPKLLKYARLDFASLIAYEAFLGMGGITRPPEPALGALIFESRHAIISGHLWLFVFPSAVLAVTLFLVSVSGGAIQRCRSV